jgi:hypothetical protein
MTKAPGAQQPQKTGGTANLQVSVDGTSLTLKLDVISDQWLEACTDLALLTLSFDVAKIPCIRMGIDYTTNSYATEFIINNWIEDYPRVILMDT